MPSTKKSPAKAGKSAAQARRTANRSDELLPSSPASQAVSTPKSGGRKRKAAPTTWAFTHTPPKADEIAKNGRHEGRNLITWTRPRMAEKLLLHLQYECARHQVDLPWESIAHRFHPGSSGGALLQHLNKLRSHLVAEGHLVPPVCQKPGVRVQIDQNIRGYVRKYENSDDTYTTREVPWDEVMDDRKFNLPDAFDNKSVSASVKREQMGGKKHHGKLSGAAVKKANRRVKVKPEEEDSDGDADWELTPSKSSKATPRRSGRAKMARTSYVEPAEPEEDDVEDGEEDEVVNAVEENPNGSDENDSGVSEASDAGVDDGEDVQSVEDEGIEEIGHGNIQLGDHHNQGWTVGVGSQFANNTMAQDPRFSNPYFSAHQMNHFPGYDGALAEYRVETSTRVAVGTRGDTLNHHLNSTLSTTPPDGYLSSNSTNPSQDSQSSISSRLHQQAISRDLHANPFSAHPAPVLSARDAALLMLPTFLDDERPPFSAHVASVQSPAAEMAFPSMQDFVNDEALGDFYNL